MAINEQSIRLAALHGVRENDQARLRKLEFELCIALRAVTRISNEIKTTKANITEATIEMEAITYASRRAA